MALKRNLFFLISITLFAVASFVLNIFNYNPNTSALPVFINFYVSFFSAFAGISTTVLFLLKMNIMEKNNPIKYFWPSVRQAVLLSLGVTTLLVLKGTKLLDWWIGISLIFVISLLELFFQTNPKNMRQVKKGSL